MPYSVNLARFRNRLVLVLAFVVCAASNLHAAEGAPTIEELKPQIEAQLPTHLTFVSAEFGDIEKESKSIINVFKCEVRITATTSEPLYILAGNANGKAQLASTADAGDETTLKATAVVLAPSMPIMERTIQLFISPGDGKTTGNPLSYYPVSNYEIVGPAKTLPIDSETRPADSNPVKQQTKVASTPSSTETDPGVIQRLLEIASTDGVIWGIQYHNSPDGVPVTLSELNRENETSLTGYISYPWYQTKHPFRLTQGGGNHTFHILDPEVRNSYTRSSLHSLTEQGATLVAPRGPTIPLSSQKSRQIQADFKKRLVPWDSPEEIANLVSINGSLVNTDTLEVVAEEWLDGAVRPIVELPTRFWSVRERGYEHKPYGACDVSNFSTFAFGVPRVSPFGKNMSNTWASIDNLRYISLRDGDLWTGEIDWKAGVLVNERNVSNIGLLTGMTPVSWYRDDVYLHNPASQETPIVRIELQTGNIEELPPLGFNNGSADGRFFFNSDGRDDQFEIYDALKRETFKMEATRAQRQSGGQLKERALPYAVRPTYWLNESTVFSQYLGWFDFATRTRVQYDDFQQIIDDIPGITQPNQVLPIQGLEYFDIVVYGYTRIKDFQIDPSSETTKRYRINIRTGEAVEIPHVKEPNGGYTDLTWIDENRYIFSVTTGGLSDVGTWMYDLRTEELKKLTPIFNNGAARAELLLARSDQDPALMSPRFQYEQHYVSPDKSEVIFGAQRGDNHILVRIDLDTGEVTNRPIDKPARIIPLVQQPISISLH